MEVTRIAARKIYEEIAEQIKEQIVGGKLPPGHKLPSTRELTERYQVGRSTMREALSMLKAMGLIEIRQGEGCFVRSVDELEMAVPRFEHLFTSMEAVVELLEARISLEVANAGLAAAKRTDDDVAALESVLSDMDSELGTETVGEKQDMRFHMTLAQATHNSIMVKLLETISAQVELTIRETRRVRLYANKEIARQLWHEHKAIADAVAARDPERAQEAMRHHLKLVENEIMAALKRNG
ncbi:FadR/GntR family transcriptional regulator [Paenibacillus flagellatus]|uniref:GntR family transcriptional regulator n=1 Tax=Paenibacillus flagellatus TaxID=2211139 RepID=A0A2V5K8E4_9BACL|nr:FadR/GntR family transcriptional regulator [Paenibacillus flagellatus]PYI55132.1 GntR family transcriptional regulator [Paenibacillus flagellatus]